MKAIAGFESRRPLRCTACSSILDIHLGECPKCLDADRSPSPDVVLATHWYLLFHGVNVLRGAQGWVSAIHSAEEVRDTVEAFGFAMDDMVEDGLPGAKQTRPE